MISVAWLAACGAAPNPGGSDVPATTIAAPTSEPPLEVATAPDDPPALPSPSWAALGKGTLVSVAVAEAVYRRAPGERWYLRVRVTNRSTKPIGVDLHDLHDHSTGPSIFRCQADDPDHPDPDWDGMIASPQRLTESRRQAILQFHQAGSLISLAPGESTEYFRPVCRDMDELIKSFERPLVTFWFRGEIDATDGREVSRLSLDLFDHLELVHPAPFHPLPDDAPGAELPPPAPAKLDAAATQAGLDPIREDARRCLAEHEVADNEDLRVSVVVAGATGRAVRIELDERFRDSALERCIQGHLRRARFTTFAAERSGFRFALRR